jgi:rhodanese-related sulfurtransferase
LLLDVRNPPEIQKVRVKGALTIPLDTLTEGASDALPADTSTPIITLCAKGKRSIYALLMLKAQGYTNVRSVWGGIAAWEEDGLPVEHG